MADDFDLDLTDLDPENLDTFAKPLPGKYHILGQKVELEKKWDEEKHVEKKTIVFDFEILAGNVANQEGRTSREYISLTGGSMKRAVLFALAAGLVTLEQLQAAKAANVNPKINWKEAEGAQLCVEIEQEAGKKYPRITFGGFWHVNDEAAKDIPKNAGYAPQGGGTETNGQTEDDPFAAFAGAN